MDQVVMAEGTEGDEMFFVKSGSLVVTATEGKDRVLIGELGPGEYFGEIAMLTGKPRTATVRARTDGELFCLKRKDAAPVLRPNRELLALLKTKIEERVHDKSAALESYRESRLSLV
jgi:CRP-like cAMP-binding protein